MVRKGSGGKRSAAEAQGGREQKRMPVCTPHQIQSLERAIDDFRGAAQAELPESLRDFVRKLCNIPNCKSLLHDRATLVARRTSSVSPYFAARTTGQELLAQVVFGPDVEIIKGHRPESRRSSSQRASQIKIRFHNRTKIIQHPLIVLRDLPLPNSIFELSHELELLETERTRGNAGNTALRKALYNWQRQTTLIVEEGRLISADLCAELWKLRRRQGGFVAITRSTILAGLSLGTELQDAVADASDSLIAELCPGENDDSSKPKTRGRKRDYDNSKFNEAIRFQKGLRPKLSNAEIAKRLRERFGPSVDKREITSELVFTIWDSLRKSTKAVKDLE